MWSYSWWDGGPSSWPIGNPHLDGKTMPILRMVPHQIRENRGISGRRWGVLEISGANSRRSSIYAALRSRQSLHIGVLSVVGRTVPHNRGGNHAKKKGRLVFSNVATFAG